MRKRFVCGLDVGTFKICATCGTVDNSGSIDILATQTVRTQGIQAGKIIDSRKVTACIKDVVAGFRKIHKIRIRRVYANIDSSDLTAKVCEKKVFFKEKTLLNKSHIVKLIDACIFSATSVDRKIIHTGLRNFSLDERMDCINPEGCVARVLKLNLVVISALIPTIKSFIKCFRRAGLTVEELVPSGCAQALGLFRDHGPRLKKYNLLIDVGSELSKLYVFRNRLVKNLAILPIGSRSITDDIATKLKVSFDCAEGLKTKYGRVHYEDKSFAQKIIVKDKLADKIIQLGRLSEIIAQRVDWLLHEIDKVFQGLNYTDEEIDQIIVTGGGSILEGFLERADKVLGRPVKMGFLSCVKDQHIQALSPHYATSIGLIHFGLQNRTRLNYSTRVKLVPVMRMVNWAKDLYQEYF